MSNFTQINGEIPQYDITLEACEEAVKILGIEGLTAEDLMGMATIMPLVVNNSYLHDAAMTKAGKVMNIFGEWIDVKTARTIED